MMLAPIALRAAIDPLFGLAVLGALALSFGLFLIIVRMENK